MFKKIILLSILILASLSASEICSSEKECVQKGKDSIDSNLTATLIYYDTACKVYSSNNACLSLGYLFDKMNKPKNSLSYYSYACSKLDDSIGCSLSTGFLMKNKEYKEALKTAEKGCSLNSPSACLKAGLIYLDFKGEYKTSNFAKASFYINKACDLKYKKACEMKDFLDKAIVTATPKCEKDNDIKNCVYIGDYLMLINKEKSLHFFEKGCSLNHASSCFFSALLKRELGLEFKKTLEKSCKLGSTNACKELKNDK